MYTYYCQAITNKYIIYNNVYILDLYNVYIHYYTITLVYDRKYHLRLRFNSNRP